MINMYLVRTVTLLIVMSLVMATCGCGQRAADSGQTKPTARSDQGAQYNGRLDGFVDGAIVGWAYDYNRRDQSVTVVILDGEKVLAEVVADKLRQDLADKNIGTGKYGFAFPIPAVLRDGKPHEIHAKIKDSTFELKNSPRKRVIP